MFTSTVPTPSITPPHEHIHTPSHTHTETTFYSLSVPLFPSSAQILPTKHFSPPFSLFFYHIPSFTCIYKPMFGRLARVPLSDLSLKPPSPSPSVTFTTSSQTYLYPCCCKWSTVLQQVGKRRKRGGGNGTEEENSSGSHCCLHGEAADLAVCSPPPRSKPLSPSAWL